MNQGGIYCAYWENDKLHIFDEKQIKAFEVNDDNPYAYRWRGTVERLTFQPNGTRRVFSTTPRA